MRPSALFAVFLFACASTPPPAYPTPSASASASATATPTATPPPTPPPPATPPPSPSIPNTWPPRRQAAHALERLAYGPRPGDVDAVANAGVEAWIRRQLKPNTIPDDAVDAKLRALPSLALSPADLHARYPRPPANMRSTVPPEQRPEQIVRELEAAKMIRAVESERQLQEVLVDFWFNHFNVFVDKGADKWLVGPYERDAIRPHVFGRFRELLGAVAHHPAMLFYLDNWLSTGAGLNENYGRELLELHTLGVDAGYTQDDVREASRAFTGWSIEKPNDEARPVFRPRKHDDAAKSVLGFEVHVGGEKDGEAVLDLVAGHPATARFVARKLCAKLVADDPPAECVRRAAAAFGDSGGDLSATYEAILFSPDFWSDAAEGAKTKTPLEVAASAARAVGATVAVDTQLPRQVARMGEPLYRAAPPTGYKETADAWVSTGALVARIDFGLALAAGRVKGVAFDREKLIGGAIPNDSGVLVDRLASAVLPRPLSPSTRDTIVAELGAMANAVAYQEAPPDLVPRALGLVLGSPEFQKQ